MNSLKITNGAKAITSGESTQDAQISYEADSIEGLLQAGGKPLLVWAFDSDDKLDLKKIDNMFRVEKMALTTKFFTCIRIPNKALDLQGNTLIIYGLDAKNYGSVGGKLPQNKAFALMGLGVKKTYTTDLKDFLSSYNRLLNSIDQLNSQRTILTEKIARLEEKGNAVETVKIEKEVEALDKKLVELDEQESKLLDFELQKEFRKESEEEKDEKTVKNKKDKKA
jgi:hypothetical protein